MRRFYCWLPLMVAVINAPQLQAAGLELTQHGTKEMAHGYAGTATLLEDASVIAHNPAGLLRLSGQQVSVGASFIHADIEYDARVLSERVEALYGLPAREVNGPGAASSKAMTVAPHVYYSQRLSDDAAVGIGLYAPFGSGTEFPAGWAGRYHSEETQQTAVNINPAFAFRVHDRLSLGMGIVIQSYRARLTNQIDLGYLVAEAVLERVAAQSGEGAAQAAAPTLLNNYGSKPEFQVLNEVEIASVAYGFSAGLLWEPLDTLRLGINYRSQVSHIAEGEAKRATLDQLGFKDNLITQVAADSGLTIAEASETLEKAFDERGSQGGDLVSRVHLPQLITFSAHYDLTNRVALMASATYTNWAVFEEIRLEYVDTSVRGGADITESGSDVRRRDLVQPLRFEDTWRVGAAVRVQALSNLVLRAGYSMDQSPVSSPDYRTPRGPDADRTIFGIGASYQITPHWDVDVAYSHINIAKADVNARENPAGTQHRAEGHSQGNLTNFAAQVNYRF